MAKSNLSDFIIPLGVIGLGVYLAPQIKNAFSGVAGGVSEAVQGTGTGVSTAAQGLGFGIGTAGAGFGTGVSTASQGLGFGIGTAGAGIGTGVSSAFTGVGQGIGDLGSSLGSTGGGFISKVGETGGSFLDIFQNTFQGTADTVENFFEGANNPRPQQEIRNRSSSGSTSILKSIFTNPIISPLGYGISKVVGSFKSTPAKIQTGTVNSNSREIEKKARASSKSSGSSSFSSSLKSTPIPTAKNFSSINYTPKNSIVKLSTGGAVDLKRKQSITVKEAEKRNKLRSSPLGKILNI